MKGKKTLKNVLEELIEDKNVLILGYGKEGKSTYKLLRKLGLCRRLDIADIKKQSDYDEKSTEFYYGDNYLDNLDFYDIVFKSPELY